MSTSSIQRPNGAADHAMSPSTTYRAGYDLSGRSLGARREIENRDMPLTIIPDETKVTQQ